MAAFNASLPVVLRRPQIGCDSTLGRSKRPAHEVTVARGRVRWMMREPRTKLPFDDRFNRHPQADREKTRKVATPNTGGEAPAQNGTPTVPAEKNGGSGVETEQTAQTAQTAQKTEKTEKTETVQKTETSQKTETVQNTETAQKTETIEKTVKTETIETITPVESIDSMLSHEAGDGGNGKDDSGNGGGDDEEDEEEDDRRRKLAEELGLSEAEAERATWTELDNLRAAGRVPLLGRLALQWPGLRDRLAANRRLPMQLGVEISVGVVTKTLAEVQGRGKKFWKEFDFYLSDLALEIFGDAILVWLLSPVAPLQGRGGGVLSRLPKHAGQIGDFGLGARLGGLMYKGVQFGVAGFGSSVVGHGLTRWLVSMRKGGEDDEEGVELAPILPTSLAWGGFLMTSSNVRYNAVNGFEQRVLDPLLGGKAGLLTAVSFALRFGNCYVGGLQWLPWARLWDLQ